MAANKKGNGLESSRHADPAVVTMLSGSGADTPAESLDTPCHRTVTLVPPPKPGTPGAPFFTGKNVSEFIKTWENMCEDYRLSAADQHRKLPRYCDRLIRFKVETLPEYKAKDWQGLKKAMLKEYRKDDAEQQMETVSFLEAYKNLKRSDDKDMKIYYQRFSLIS